MTENKENPVKRPLYLRILAWIVVVILMGMYIFTLVVAITNKGDVTGLFMACVGATIVLPGILWINLRLFKLSMERNRKEYMDEAYETLQRDEGKEGNEN